MKGRWVSSSSIPGSPRGASSPCSPLCSFRSWCGRASAGSATPRCGHCLSITGGTRSSRSRPDGSGSWRSWVRPSCGSRSRYLRAAGPWVSTKFACSSSTRWGPLRARPAPRNRCAGPPRGGSGHSRSRRRPPPTCWPALWCSPRRVPLFWAAGLWVAGAVVLGVAEVRDIGWIQRTAELVAWYIGGDSFNRGVHLPTGGSEGWTLLPTIGMWTASSAFWISLGLVGVLGASGRPRNH